MEVEDVWALVDKLSFALPGEAIPLASALGMTLAQDARADLDHPPFDRSAVDGYAIGAGDDSESFVVIETIRAGESKALSLQKGQAVRIMTGAELPSAGLIVIMQEHVSFEGDAFRIVVPQLGTNVRLRGEDFRAGDVLLASGTVLSPVALATLASIGITQPLVIRRPRVVHLTGGDEIVPADVTPGAGQIRDANSFLVRALLGNSRVTDVRLAHLPDDLARARERIAAVTAAPFDVLLFSGGASVGDHDFTGQLLREMGFEIHCQQVNVRPGRPLIFATRERQIAFGIPGNPVSHFACYHLFIARALARLMGGSPAALGPAVLDSEVPGKSNPRVTYWPARTTRSDETRRVHPVAWNSSGDLASLIGVDVLIRIEGGQQSLPEVGDIVDCLWV